MNLGRTVAGALADRSRQVVGVAFCGAASLHYSALAPSASRTLRDAFAAGDVPAAAAALASYSQTHPAYVLAFLAGVALLVQRP